MKYEGPFAASRGMYGRGSSTPVQFPGMQVNAEIHLGTRTVLEYLLSSVQKIAIELC